MKLWPSITIAAAAGCGSLGDPAEDTVVQHGELAYANARWIEGNAGPIDSNANPVDANANPVDANAVWVDGVLTRTRGINDHLANTLTIAPEAVLAAGDQGWYLPATTDLVVEGYPASFTGFDRCLALDADGGAVARTWRIAPSAVVDRDGYSYVESGFLEVDDGAGWTRAPDDPDTSLYLPATTAKALTVMLDPAAVPDDQQRPMLLRVRVLGSLPVRDPTDLAADTVGRIGARMYRKQLVVASMCLPDPADASIAAWIPIGAVTFGDAYGFDVAAAPDSANRPDGDGIRALAPWLRFKGYIGRDPGDTSAKAEMYYTGGLVTRGDPALEPELVCDPAPTPAVPTTPDAPAAAPELPTREIVPVAELNARIAAVFANAIDVPLGGPGDGTAFVGMTVNGTPIRVSLVTPPGCTMIVPGALAPYGYDATVDWSPSYDELIAPHYMDSLAGPPLATRPDESFRSRNSTACGLDNQRVERWLATAPADDGTYLPPRRALADLRAAHCDGVALAIAPDPAEHHGRFTRWDGEPGGLVEAYDIHYWITASAAGVIARCGDRIYDREFEHGVCEEDNPLPIVVHSEDADAAPGDGFADDYTGRYHELVDAELH